MSASGVRVLLVASGGPALPPNVGAATAAAATLEIAHVSTVNDAVRRLGEDRFDAMLLDLSAADAPGLDALTRLHDHAPDVPIVVFTRAEEEALAVQALKAGAQDSLVKDEADASLLVRAIRYAIERHQLQMALRAMALVDDLTGLYNRRGFQTLARQHMKMADRVRRRVSHIFVDLDGLKTINDTHGHREGDRALLETAELLKTTFRESDIIARIGGDEFVVLALENAGHAHEQWAARLQENLRIHNDRPGRRYRLSLSMGMAYYDPDVPCPIDDLMARADALMYEQKRTKRRASPSAGVPTTPPPHRNTPSRPSLAPRAD